MSLEDRIFNKFAKSKFGNEKEELYLPEGCINELVIEATIKETLKSSLDSLSVSEQKLFVEFIEQKAKKVFATAILASLRDYELCQAMRKFRDYGFVDDLLPIPNYKSNSTARIPDAFSDKPWTEWKFFQFYNHQWKFLVPVFMKDQLKYNFERDCILPFKSVGSQPKEGTFGDVFEVEIHESHQKGHVFMVSA